MSCAILSLLSFAFTVNAQTKADFIIRGLIADSATCQPLLQATVLLRSVTDSARAGFQLADAQGRFTFPNIPQGRYQLTVSYVGYAPFQRPVLVSGTSQTLDLGTLALRRQTVRLREVNVQRRAPITIRNDTLEFDAGAFATQPNALVEDLLRKLPGVDVTGDGSVRAQGRVVQQVFVDGKPFFGNDPKMATRNLPAHLIDKIQVFDNRSDQSAFSGVDDGGRVRTINIVTKPEGRRGQFGQQALGYGTAGRYQAGGGINRFRQQSQFSLLGQANNINQTGYSLPAYTSRTRGGTNDATGQSDGITRSTGAGLNYADRWGKRTRITASYVATDATTLTGQRSLRQTLLPGTSSQPTVDTTRLALLSDTDSRSTTRAVNHSINIRLDYQLDSMNLIRFSSGFSGYTTSNASQLTTETRISNRQPLNQSLSETVAAGTNRTINNTLLWMHRFYRPGRTLSLSLNTALNRLVSDGSNRAQNAYYRPQPGQDSLPPIRIDQRNAQHTRSTTNELSLYYTEPLTDQQTIEFRYNLATNQGTSERVVSDVNEATGISQPNARLSSQFQSTFITNRLGSGWQVRRPRYSYTLGVDIQQATLHSAYQTGTSPLNRQYVNLLPNLVFRPQLAQNQYLQVQYQTRTTAPSVTQLQPVADVTNPLFIQAGNPALRPEFTHSLSLSYNGFQTKTYRTVFALLTVGLTNHRIVPATTLDVSGIQVTRPVNASGYTTANGTVSIGRPLAVGSLKGTLNLTTNVILIRGVSFINTQTNRSLALMAGQSVSVNTTVASTIEVGLSGTVNHQRALYSLQRQADNQSWTTLISSQLYCPLPLGFRLATDLTYVATTGRSAGYNQPYARWNGYVSRAFLTGQQGELRLQVFDLLNQNRSLARTVTDTYVEDRQTQVLKRYFLLSFIYNLWQFGKTS
ncbi:outer membrane beta-barrel protein [Spirosoma utsteinense]|uniref:Outer membrane protein beta-barrel domain-containing protein n=1 Tax=Spirosoma utsteinense TaxID=2585773 RepID=A0ABR6WFR2_9BACT|nr:outer membrane beta-barrel protein [Spirosoma utsteinense]MBC3788913.1 hypothetical protein [Spirosoma utsteinense]MBC3794830.1 hypothetical protein [Spirosoma utsteinense]